MGPGLLSLLVFIALIIVWAVILKRNIAEAAFISLLTLPFFGGSEQAPDLIVKSLRDVVKSEAL